MHTEEELTSLVTRARSGDLDAFANLVRRFQGMAFGYAYSILGDFAVAQDVAQEAFIEVYRQLASLRKPDAFPGWFRRILFKHCDRVTRRKQVRTVPLDVAENLPTEAPDTGDALERQKMESRALAAVKALPEHQRIASTLFYIDGYSQKDIASFLDVPVTTVQKRLYDARRRLKEKVMAEIKHTLEANMPDQEGFVHGVSFLLNPRVAKADLTQGTGIRGLDQYLYCVTNVLRIAMGELLRSVFLIGSYAHGGHTPDSDVNWCLVWREGSDYDDWQKGFSLVVHISEMSRYDIDRNYNATEKPFYDLTDRSGIENYGCGAVLRLAVKEQSLLLWGEDIRPQILLSPSEDLLEDVITPPPNWIKQTHYDTLNQKIAYPLTDPSPEKQDSGYGDPRTVARGGMHMARALVFLETGEFLFNKTEVAPAFERHIGGKWSALVRDISNLRHAMLSQQQKQQTHLQVCGKMAAFQNYFLERLASKGLDLSSDLSSMPGRDPEPE